MFSSSHSTRIGYSSFIAVIWAYLSRTFLRGCPVIFLAHPPVLASASPRRANGKFPAGLLPGFASVLPHRAWAHTACANHTAARLGAPAPWPPFSPCGPRATSVPRRGVCRFRRTCAEARPRFHSGLSDSLGPFLRPNWPTPHPRLFGRFLRQAYCSCPRKRPPSPLFTRKSGVY